MFMLTEGPHNDSNTDVCVCECTYALHPSKALQGPI